jgi:hypothetical protein
MGVEAIATSVSGIGAAGSIPGGVPQDMSVGQPTPSGNFGAGSPSAPEATTAPAQTSLESRAGRVGGPAEGPLTRMPEVSASPHQSNSSISQSVLDRVNTMQKGDAAWRTGDAGRPQTMNEPSLKIASREPGPASAQLKPDPMQGLEIAGRPMMQPGKSQNPGFDSMLHQLEQVSGQVVQVSIVSKTTSSFTGSLNKLLSSG